MRDFYLVIKAKVEAGQYILVDMVDEIDKAYAKSLITFDQAEELKALAEVKVDPKYVGNKYPRPYDLDQDVDIVMNETSIIELFELVMGSGGVKANLLDANTRSSIGNLYLKQVIEGRRKFSEVHPSKQQEVADKLIAMGRTDLIDDPAFLPQPPVTDPTPEEPVKEELK